jgi:hypothetical protein
MGPIEVAHEFIENIPISPALLQNLLTSRGGFERMNRDSD